MSATADAPLHPPVGDGSKRDFLKLVGTSAAVIGVGAVAWPFIDSMNPSSDVLALSSVEVDIAPVTPGMGVTVQWRGKPVFVRRRTPEEIKTAQAVPMHDLIDPATDAERVKPGHEQWVIMIGICTHLGCIPLGNKPTDPRGDYGGYLCPCHGSQYRCRRTGAPRPCSQNLYLPDYAFLTDTKIKIG